jgi:Ca2+-binding EF-hand superfamily protein
MSSTPSRARSPPTGKGKAAGRQQWVVHLDKNEGEDVGLELDSNSGRILSILKGGPIDKFNLAFPARAVRKGDRILVVNGKYGRRIFAPDGELTMSASCDIKIERSTERSRWLQSLALKNLTLDEAELMYTTFQVLDMDESGKPQGLLDASKAFIWFRSLGWVWSDDELTSVLFPGERGASEKEKFSAVELLRAADAHANERYKRDRDAEAVWDTFKVFDFDGTGMVMRADIYKELALCNPPLGAAECNLMLETLGYPSNVLTLNAKEIAGRITECLGELPKMEAMAI